MLIRHTFEQGTVLLGTTRGDGTWPILSGLRRNWRYGSYREDLLADAARLDDELRYWQEVRDQQIAAGTATNYGPDTIAKGDLIEVHGMGFKVVRVNPKSVTVEWFVGTHTVKYHKITGHRPAAEAANPQPDDPPPAS